MEHLILSAAKLNWPRWMPPWTTRSQGGRMVMQAYPNNVPLASCTVGGTSGRARRLIGHSSN